MGLKNKLIQTSGAKDVLVSNQVSDIHSDLSISSQLNQIIDKKIEEKLYEILKNNLPIYKDLMEIDIDE